MFSRRMRNVLARPSTAWVGDIAAGCVSLGWFLYNVTLHDMYKGRICCDSVNYIDLAKEIHSVQDVVLQYGWRTNGYPVFLKLHQFLVESVFGLSIDFVYVSLVSTFILHVAAAAFFYTSLRKAGLLVPRLLLWLLVLHPGLVSHTAVPLTDGFVTTIVMFAAGCALRAGGRSWPAAGWFSLTGALFAWAVLIRPAHLPAALVTVFAIAAVGVVFAVRTRKIALACVSLACPVLFALVLAPRTAACMRLDHRVCLYTTQDRDAFLRTGLDIQRNGARTYSVNWVDEQGDYHAFVRTVDDPLFLRSFGCLASGEPPLMRAVSCYRHNIPFLPAFFAKKTVSLFDNFHLNTYAAWITEPWHIAWNRFFGLAGFMGFGTFFVLCGVRLWHRKSLPVVFLYPVVYWLTSLIPSTDSRYGFPLVPFALAALCVAPGMMRSPKNRCALYAVWTVCATIFILQTFEWDLYDPLVFGK